MSLELQSLLFSVIRGATRSSSALRHSLSASRPLSPALHRFLPPSRSPLRPSSIFPQSQWFGSSCKGNGWHATFIRFKYKMPTRLVHIVCQPHPRNISYEASSEKPFSPDLGIRMPHRRLHGTKLDTTFTTARPVKVSGQDIIER